MVGSVSSRATGCRYRAAAAFTLLALAICAGCTRPLLNQAGHTGYGDCSPHSCGDVPTCDDDCRQPALYSRLQAGYHEACKKCGYLGPHCNCSTSHGASIDPPPPSRFHPVPTRPVFGGPYEAW